MTHEMAQYVLKIAHLAISVEPTRSPVAVSYPDDGSCEYTVNAVQGRRCMMHDITVFKILRFRLSTRKPWPAFQKKKWLLETLFENLGFWWTKKPILVGWRRTETEGKKILISQYADTFGQGLTLVCAKWKRYLSLKESCRFWETCR